VRLSAYAPADLYTPGRFLLLISVRGWVDPRAIVRLEGLGKLKKSTSSGLDPATFRLVAECLNQLCYITLNYECEKRSWRFQSKTHAPSVAINSSGLDPNRKFRCFAMERHKTRSASKCMLSGSHDGSFLKVSGWKVFILWVSRGMCWKSVHEQIKHVKLITLLLSASNPNYIHCGAYENRTLSKIYGHFKE
jgi:hypothetical protein